MTSRTATHPDRISVREPARRRFRLGRTSAAAAIVVAGIGIAVTVGVSSGGAPADHRAVLAHPRAADVPSNRSVVAWISGTKACYGDADLQDSRQPEQHLCTDMPTGWSTATAPSLWSKPHFLGEPHPGDGKSILAVGLTSGAVKSVDVTMTSGAVVKADVVPLEGAATVGAYAVWLPMNTDTIGWTDIRSVTGLGASGSVITRLG